MKVFEEWLTEEQKFSKGQSNEFDEELIAKTKKALGVNLKYRDVKVDKLQGKINTNYGVTLTDSKNPKCKVAYYYFFDEDMNQFIRWIYIDYYDKGKEATEFLKKELLPVVKKWFKNANSSRIMYRDEDAGQLQYNFRY